MSDYAWTRWLAVAVHADCLPFHIVAEDIADLARAEYVRGKKAGVASVVLVDRHGKPVSQGALYALIDAYDRALNDLRAKRQRMHPRPRAGRGRVMRVPLTADSECRWCQGRGVRWAMLGEWGRSQKVLVPCVCLLTGPEDDRKGTSASSKTDSERPHSR